MSSQGKLYLEVAKKADLPVYFDKRAQVTLESDVFNLLDEAKADFPTVAQALKNSTLPKYDDSDVFKVCYAYHDLILEWQSKWLGGKPKTDVLADGGCAGHIDLGKLQDLEKKPNLVGAKPAPFVGTVTKEG